MQRKGGPHDLHGTDSESVSGGSAGTVEADGGDLQQLQQQQERIEFMEELSGMERYTVYKGRVMG